MLACEEVHGGPTVTLLLLTHTGDLRHVASPVTSRLLSHRVSDNLQGRAGTREGLIPTDLPTPTFLSMSINIIVMIMFYAFQSILFLVPGMLYV